MFRQSNRGTVVWLLIIGLALALALLAGNVATEIGAILLAAYLGLVLLIASNADLGAVVNRLPVSFTREQQVSEVAQEAIARARSQPDFDSMIRLMDIGLIADEARPDGMSVRKGRFVSLDDDGVRPFAIVEIPAGLAGRLGLVRFEMRDEAGQLQYIYEEEKWLQAGENVLLPDYRLPLRKRSEELPAGGWSARVTIDGGLLGVHNFNLGPSLRTRREQLSSDGEVLRERVWRTQEDDESLPLSLEELLRQQSRQRRQQ